MVNVTDSFGGSLLDVPDVPPPLEAVMDGASDEPHAVRAAASISELRIKANFLFIIFVSFCLNYLYNLTMFLLYYKEIKIYFLKPLYDIYYIACI